MAALHRISYVLTGRRRNGYREKKEGGRKMEGKEGTPALAQWLQQHAVTICCSRWTWYPGNCIKAGGGTYAWIQRAFQTEENNAAIICWQVRSPGLTQPKSSWQLHRDSFQAVSPPGLGPSHQGSGKEHCLICFLQGECQHIWNNSQVVETNPDGASMQRVNVDWHRLGQQTQMDVRAPRTRKYINTEVGPGAFSISRRVKVAMISVYLALRWDSEY